MDRNLGIDIEVSDTYVITDYETMENYAQIVR